MNTYNEVREGTDLQKLVDERVRFSHSSNLVKNGFHFGYQLGRLVATILDGEG